MTIHRLPITGAFPYFKKGTANTSREKFLQRLVYAIKNGGTVTMTDGRRLGAAEGFVTACRPGARERRFLNRERTLVPMPKSTLTPWPPSANGWPGYALAQALAQRKLARDARPLIRRATAVESSRAARSAGRKAPSVAEHIESLEVDDTQLEGVIAITIVDDMVSSGSNTMGAAQCLRAAGFRGDIAVFSAGYLPSATEREALYGRIIWPQGNRSSFRRSEASENFAWQAELPGPWTPEPPEHDEWCF